MEAGDRRTLWQIPPEADVRHREWDGEFVFFHGAGGDTYRLSAVAAVVLLELQAGPSSEAGLADGVVARLGLDPSEVAAGLSAVLAELARLEFVEPLT